MRPANHRICREFSEGNLQFCLPYLAENLVWNIVGEDRLEGIESVKIICEKVMSAGRPTFEVTRIIDQQTQLVIEGFGGDQQTDSDAVYYFCDIFDFDNNLITDITSYVIACDKQKPPLLKKHEPAGLEFY